MSDPVSRQRRQDRPDVMGGPDDPSDVMEGGSEPADENPDVLAPDTRPEEEEPG